MNGAILIMETESSNWFTGRGIRVGDQFQRLMMHTFQTQLCINGIL